jgi:hypothetical protein
LNTKFCQTQYNEIDYQEHLLGLVYL